MNCTDKFPGVIVPGVCAFLIFSMVSEVRADESKHSDHWTVESDKRQIVIEDGRFRYLRDFGGIERLYDLSVDPSASENLITKSDFKTELFRFRSKLPGSAFVKTSESKWIPMDFQGWTLNVSHRFFEGDRRNEDLLIAFQLLDRQLSEIVSKVPPSAVEHLQRVPLYFSTQYPDSRPRAEYHPGAGWLKDNGRDPVMVKSVEFSNIPVFEAETRRMPNFALHELAHAYHDRVLGFDQNFVRQTYERAKASGKYDSVLRQNSKGEKRLDKAYAMTNHKEYFAELTESFFTKNDFFPFDRNELEAHDPAAVKMLEAVWNAKQ